METPASASDGEPKLTNEPRFSISHRLDGGEAQITLSGELDLGDADQVALTVQQVLRGEVAAIDVDVQELRFIDSAGLQALLDGRTSALAAGATLRVVGASASVQRIVSLAGLEDLLF